MADNITAYPAFWHHYLREHSSPRTRAPALFGTVLALAILVLGLFVFEPWLIPAAIVCGYFLAWIGHMTIGRNRPATFTYPLWSLGSDFRRFFLWIIGQPGRHLRAEGVEAATRKG
ncbi:DUF962 domain-containing protein [Jiella pelagia]|uniref:DUF962 domain-containing protein n=1 Tax=Jiella pelagia TaxID=2986949 RepID=A0ABY7C5B7_9HYPH|nr:DUF962 domain-containing protein [Jiella pelagia]WAP70219.1 DUF962 domain-containing protein [Jiella pelagia]